MPKYDRLSARPSILGHLLSSAQSRWAKAHRPSLGRPRSYPQPFDFYKIPNPVILKRRRTYKKDGDHADLNASQVCFRHADTLYTTLSKAKRAEWKAAVKRPGMSGYDLFMKEAVALLAKGKRPPDHPSISGGWSTRKAVASTTLAFPECETGFYLRRVEVVPIYWPACGGGNNAFQVRWYTQVEPGDDEDEDDLVNAAWHPDSGSPFHWKEATTFFPYPAQWGSFNTCILPINAPHVWGYYAHRVNGTRWQIQNWAATVDHDWTWLHPERVPWGTPWGTPYEFFNKSVWQLPRP